MGFLENIGFLKSFRTTDTQDERTYVFPGKPMFSRKPMFSPRKPRFAQKLPENQGFRTKIVENICFHSENIGLLAENIGFLSENIGFLCENICFL